MSAELEYDVFLSHNAQDKPRVRRLAERLKQAGLRVWFDEWNVGAGDIIALKVDEGLEQSRVLVLCISPHALASGWVALERSTAIHRDPANEGRRFIPLLLADCQLPDTLRRYKYVDFREEAKAAFAELIEACRSDSIPEKNWRKEAGNLEIAKASEFRKEVVNLGENEDFTLESKFSYRGPLARIAWSPTGESIAFGSTDGTVFVWEPTGSLPPKRVIQHRDWIECLAWSRDGLSLASSAADGRVEIWHPDSTAVGLSFMAHRGAMALGVDWSPDGKTLITCSADTTIVSWNAQTGKKLDEFSFHQNKVEKVVWSPCGRWFASCSWDNTVAIWRLGYGRPSGVLRGHSAAVYSLAWSPCGEVLCSAGWDNSIRVWNTSTHRCIAVIEGHRGQLCWLSFSSDGRFLASKAKDHTVRIWHRHDWREVARLHESSGRVKSLFPSVAFRPKGYQLATINASDSSIRIWTFKHLSACRERSEPLRRYVNAKVVLIGEGTVGKTSLAHRLIDDKYVVRDRTHGMNVWRLDLPEPTALAAGDVREGNQLIRPDAPEASAFGSHSDGDNLDREALLWDLAGQEDYRLIHQLFLDETALALLLINPQNADPFAEAGDWLKALDTAAGVSGERQGASRRSHANEGETTTAEPAASALRLTRGAVRLLIFSQIDVGGMKLGSAKIERFREQYGFAGWLPTSAKTGENCSDKKNGGRPSKLKQLIAESTPWSKLPWTSTPRLLAELKNAVVAMRDQRDIRLLRFAELAQRLEQALPGEKFDESDVRTAVTLLANHGLARPLKFGDLVLLQPELINGYAGAIVRAARAHTDEIGCVLEADIYRPDFDFTGVERLKHRPDEELLLRALVQTFLDHSLCIAEDTPQGRQLVFPSQYRREKDIPYEPTIFVSYTFGGEWQTVWTTLVVRLWYSNEFEHRELWRNAAEFAFSDRTLGLKIDNQQGEGTGTISLYFDKEVPDELKAIFIEYVHRHLAKYACDVTRDRRYVCPNCGKPVKDHDEVRKRLAAKKDFIYCQRCDEKVPLIDFIEQRLQSDPVARKILTMEETATRGLDTQALEQILIGHMMAIAGEANQIFRPVAMFDYGIDGEVEFRDDDGKASGKRIYVQLKSGNSYLRTRKRDGREVFDVKNDRHLEYWISQPVDVYLVIRQTDDTSGGQAIRWMNVTRYLKARKDKPSHQIIFDGEKLDIKAVWNVRDEFFPAT